MRLLGLDPGLRRTGWGVIETEGNQLRFIAAGTITSHGDRALSDRLVELHNGIAAVIEAWRPSEAAVEETFVNKNPTSTLKLGVARGVALLVPARAGLTVAEYPANLIKKSVVGTGHADKAQIQAMVARLLPGAATAITTSVDAADALAVAITHAHHAATRAKVGGIMSGGAR